LTGLSGGDVKGCPEKVFASGPSSLVNTVCYGLVYFVILYCV